MTKQGGWPATGFGGRLRVLREEKGLSQQQLADQAKCHRFTVAKLERGTQEPAWPLVLALAEALGVEVGAFVVEKGEQAEAEEPRPRGRPRSRGKPAEAGTGKTA